MSTFSRKPLQGFFWISAWKIRPIRARNVHDGFSEKNSSSREFGIIRPKNAQNGPKSDVYGFFSKSVPRIFLIFWKWLESISALVLLKTFFQTTISQERKEQMKIRFDFQNPLPFLYKKCYRRFFIISTPSGRKSGPEMVPKTVFRFSQVCVLRFPLY